LGNNEEDNVHDDTLLKRLWVFLTRGEAGTDTKKQIEKILDEVEEKGFIDEDQGEMIQNVLVLKDTSVSEIMVPKGDIVALPSTVTMDELARVFVKEGYSRVPIYEDTLDNILGIVYAKDLLSYWDAADRVTSIKQLMHPVYFVPEGKKLMDLLKEFKEKQTKIAIIIDEYGNVDGLITIGDILQEIVGDVIGEEGEEIEEEIVQKEEGLYSVDPMISIDEFAEFFDADIPEGDYDTVSGFITSRMERIPKPGETFEYGDMVFEITGADKRRIHKLLVHVPSRKED
jgi:CBS domain containing-hemolysin-like protein